VIRPIPSLPEQIPDALVIRLAGAWREDYSQPGVVDALVMRGIRPEVAQAKVAYLVRQGVLEKGTALNYVWPKGT